eukprot:CAMPEP_0204624528 /NCGR_PEP_ID=MMETSP0717-20131115/10286_1 /ASSEMBLY_ACC=CAM_ASM_000666 /TAXON_ID=230516 /ORGANISM="Chaetoceros curvisetus" /LENGTH=95 /DNA_ID=CAMNT_0051639951 /DNA_START=322 /DNA_END=606 /DNA_ORIENTATION=+
MIDGKFQDSRAGNAANKADIMKNDKQPTTRMAWFPIFFEAKPNTTDNRPPTAAVIEVNVPMWAESTSDSATRKTSPFTNVPIKTDDREKVAESGA